MQTKNTVWPLVQAFGKSQSGRQRFLYSRKVEVHQKQHFIRNMALLLYLFCLLGTALVGAPFTPYVPSKLLSEDPGDFEVLRSVESVKSRAMCGAIAR